MCSLHEVTALEKPDRSALLHKHVRRWETACLTVELQTAGGLLKYDPAPPQPTQSPFWKGCLALFHLLLTIKSKFVSTSSLCHQSCYVFTPSSCQRDENEKTGSVIFCSLDHAFCIIRRLLWELFIHVAQFVASSRVKALQLLRVAELASWLGFNFSLNKTYICYERFLM